MKNIFCIICICLVFVCDALSMNVLKTRGLSQSGDHRDTKIFRDCFSRHFYEIRISGSSRTELDATYTIRVLPILKGCKGGRAFPFFPGKIENTGITLTTSKSYVCVYVSPLTKWTKDTWKDIGGDWSKGIIVSSVIIELIKDGENVPVKVWTNCPSPMFKKYFISNMKSNLKDEFVHWLDDIVYPMIEDRNLIDEDGRIVVGSWNEMTRR